MCVAFVWRFPREALMTAPVFERTALGAALMARQPRHRGHRFESLPTAYSTFWLICETDIYYISSFDDEHRSVPYFSHYQRLNKTSDDACENPRFLTPACGLRTKALFTQFMGGAANVAPTWYAVANRKAGCHPGASAPLPLLGTSVLAIRGPGR
jgi:hypothetical protein